jgi:nucleoside-diphosphate-sugar epimerase
MTLPTISILGCGWVGLPLAEFLIKEGYRIKGSTTSTEKLALLKDKGIDPFLIDLAPAADPDILASFLDSEILIINIPPGTRTKTSEFHIQQIEQLIPAIQKSPVRNILYVSATSVYHDLNRVVTEADVTTPEQASNKTLATAEMLLGNITGKPTTVLRCSGLAGYDRILINYFTGKKDLPGGQSRVNLIHRDDVVGIIYAVLKQNRWGQTYNISAPQHPTRQEYYDSMAIRSGYEAPVFAEEKEPSFRIVGIEKMTSDLSYSFLYPDPLKFAYSNF